MPELEILIKTKAELSGAESYLASVERQIGVSKAQGKGFEELESKAARARAAIDAFKEANSVLTEAVAKQAAAEKTQAAAAVQMADAKQKAIQDSVQAIPPVIAHHNALSDALAKQKKAQDEAAQSSQTLNNKLRELVPGYAKLQDLISLLGTGTLGYVVAGLAAVAAAAKVAAAGVREYAEAQEVVTRLDAALAQTGQLTEGYREKLQGLASEMSKTTAIADEKWLAVLARLTQFGANAGNIEQYADAVKNLAGIMGSDVEGAAVAMSRAMGGSFTMFSRLGIHIDETKSQAEKLTELFKKLADVGGGQLEASTRTLAGQYRGLKVAIGEVFEGIGGFIARTGVLSAVLDAAATVATALGDALGRTVPKVDGLVNAANRTVQSVDGAGGAMGRGKTAAEAYATALKKATDALGKLIEQEDSRLSFEEKLAQINMRKDLATIDALKINPVQKEVLKGALVQSYADEEFKRRDSSKAFVQSKISAEADALSKDITAAEKDKKAAAAYSAAAAPAVAARASERESLLQAEEMKSEAERAKQYRYLSTALRIGLPPQLGFLAQIGGSTGGDAEAAAGSAEAAARMQRKRGQDIQAGLGQPPVPTSKPGFDVDAARGRRSDLTEQYNFGQIERARSAEIYGAERGLNDVTTGEKISAAETKAIKGVADAAEQFNVNYSRLPAAMETIIRGMLQRINAGDARVERLANELRDTRGVVSNLRMP